MALLDLLCLFALLVRSPYSLAIAKSNSRYQSLKSIPVVLLWAAVCLLGFRVGTSLLDRRPMFVLSDSVLEEHLEELVSTHSKSLPLKRAKRIVLFQPDCSSCQTTIARLLASSSNQTETVFVCVRGTVPKELQNRLQQHGSLTSLTDNYRWVIQTPQVLLRTNNAWKVVSPSEIIEKVESLEPKGQTT